MSNFIYLRGLRRAEHTVFSVADGQKSYRDPISGRDLAYSSGQQVKRSILDAFVTALNKPFAPITFTWTIKNDKATQGEAWSLCDPSYPDQLVGGYMKAEKESSTIKRRSPLSISAMRPIHPLLGGMETKAEAMSFDRGEVAQLHQVKVYFDNGGRRELLSDEQVRAWTTTNQRNLPPKKWIDPQKRASGLFVYDVAIDLRTLFCVSLNPFEPEVTPETIEKLKNAGWYEGRNFLGPCLICPKKEREEIIDALANALVEWRITCNQSRTFSLMDIVALAISSNASQLAYAIRAEINNDTDYERGQLVIDSSADARLFITPSVSNFIPGETGYATAPKDAIEELKTMMKAHSDTI